MEEGATPAQCHILFYYETSPSQAQLIDYYHRALVGMMNGGFFRR
jgi:hypothetical protein